MCLPAVPPSLLLLPPLSVAPPGTPVQQWITVYNKFKPMKQRYHCNVASNRLLVHVEKGWADGLYITSVCSCQGAWAVVMDAGSGFTSQIYRVRRQRSREREGGGSWACFTWKQMWYCMLGQLVHPHAWCSSCHVLLADNRLPPPPQPHLSATPCPMASPPPRCTAGCSCPRSGS